MSLDCVGVIVVKEAGNKVKVTEVAGSSTVVTEKGNSVTVTGVISGGGGIGSGTVTSVDLTAGAGITVSGGPITTIGSILVINSDRGSSQNIFKNIAVSGQPTIIADINDDTLTIVAGTGVAIITDATTDTLTISATGSGGTVTSIATSAPITGGTITTTGTIGITQAGVATDGFLSSTDWNTFNNKQGTITLTTTGSTGAATLISNTLNIPNYTDQFVGTVTSVNLTAGARIEVSGGPITTSGSITVTHGISSGADVATAQSFRLRVIADGGIFEAFNDVAIAIGSLEDIATPQDTDNSGGTVLQNVVLDEFGHLLGVGSITLDTDDIIEGSTNLYFTDLRARSALSAGTGITYSTSTGVITNNAPDQVVVLTAGTGITTSGTYPSFTITNSAPDQVVSLTGAGTTSISGAYPSFTITSNDQFVGTVTSVNLTAGTGITVSGGPVTTSGSITVTNNDRGSSQNIFKNFAVAGQSTIVADTNDDTLTVVAGTGVTITTNDTTDTLTISATGSGGTVTSIGTTAPITGGTITATGTIGITQAGVATDGFLSSTDWNTFNSKEPALTKGNLTEATSAVLTITGGTGAVIGTGTTIQVAQAGVATDGFLSSTDWNTFNGKQGALIFSAPLVNTSGTVSIPAATGLVDGYLSATDFVTFNGKQDTLTLTTTGSTGAATLIGATLNIPNYADQFVGTVTSVGLTASTGISVSGSPITTSGSITVTNTAPDLTVVLTASTGITTSGTYPNFTIANSAPDQTVVLTGAGTTTISGAYPSFTITSNDQNVGTVTSVNLIASTGISVSGGPITSSGNITVANTAPDQTVVLTAGTGITTSGTYPNFTVTNSAPDQTVALTAGTGISVSGTYPNFTVTNSSPSSGGTVTSVAALTLGTTGTDLSSTVVNDTTTPVITLQVPTASATNRGALSSADFSTFNSKQAAITLTTTGSTGAATFISNTLNIPSYTDQFVGTVTSVNLTAGTRIEVAGGPVTTSGSITVTHGVAAGADFITAQTFEARVIADGGIFEALGEVAIAIGSLSDAASPSSTDFNDGVVIQNVAIDEFGHLLGVGAADLDDRYPRVAFKNIAVAGQTTIEADAIADTLTAVGGTGIALTTNASTDTLTITNSAPDQTVALTAGTGITTSGTYPSFTVTNSAPDQTVALTAGTGITTSGTYPSFTVTNSAPDQTVVLTASTGITTSGTYPSFTIANSAPDQVVVLTAGTGITTSGTYPSFTVTNDDRGSSQNIFKNIAVSGQTTIAADNNDDTLTVVGGTGITVTTSHTTDTLTVTNSAPDQTVALTAGTGITVSGTYPNFTVANSQPANPPSRTESLTFKASTPYTVVSPFDKVVIDSKDVALPSPSTIGSGNKVLAIVTLEVENTGLVGFTGFTLRLLNQTTSAAVGNAQIRWSSYMDPSSSEFGFTLVTYHIPIADTGVSLADVIEVQLQLEVGTCDIHIANFTLMSITK